MNKDFYNDLTEKEMSSSFVYDGTLLKVYSDVVKLPNGMETKREYIKHFGAVCIVALNDNGNIIMEKQYRYPHKRVITELPAGKLDNADENPLDAAKRELKEETGYSAEKWELLGKFIPTPAYSNERIYIYLAEKLKRGKQKLDENEFLQYNEIQLSKAVKMIENGEIEDGKTIAALLLVEKKLANQKQ